MACDLWAIEPDLSLVQTVPATLGERASMTKAERTRLAFQGWFDRYGRDFAITPEPNEEVRRAIAWFAFQAGWKARADKAQKRVLRLDEARRIVKRGGKGPPPPVGKTGDAP